MTVKQLRETLKSFPDNCIALIPKPDKFYTEVVNVSQGVNECDFLVFLEGRDEDD